MEEVARIRQEMESIVSETHFASIKEFITFLKTNDRYAKYISGLVLFEIEVLDCNMFFFNNKKSHQSFYAKTEEEYLQFVRAVAQEAYAALPLLFGYLPRCPFGGFLSHCLLHNLFNVLGDLVWSEVFTD